MKKMLCMLVYAVLLFATDACHAEGGNFAALSKSVCSEKSPSASSHAFDYRSPDGEKSIVVGPRPDGELFTRLNIGLKSYNISLPEYPCPEFLWASDSTAFFVNSSDGGAVGNFDITVIKIEANGILKIDPIKLVRRDFKSNYPKCFSPEEPNFAGVNWINGSKNLLVIGEVIPHSNCDMAGTFAAYEIAVGSGKILKKYSQIKAKQSFMSWMGPELKNADDNCFLKPGSCDIPDLHKRK
ncbi:hypothetical protein [Undibacterium flavidum]|uniref:WD40 repeat protein n=1 Tax=Undibacterium flavidum TaxID=2762297 RepID=A0ABR6Y7S0_9BURK|nr:hypothetical protein [Undibacterium flavidum]MBC3872660.1 hypothetical protein [Undibacterium flavidum]